MKIAGNQGICPEIWAVWETSARRMAGYAEILFAGKLIPAAKPCHHTVHTKQ
jgi:hypothetical protein